MLEVPGFVKISANNGVKGFNLISEDGSSNQLVVSSGDIVGAWHKIYYFRAGSLNMIRGALDTTFGFQFTLASLASLTITQLYILGFQATSANPKFMGYLRDLILINSLSAMNAINQFYYNDPYHQQDKSADFYLRFDEQYTTELFNYVSLLTTDMPVTVTYAQDTANPVLCSDGQLYNTATQICQSI